VSAPSPSSQHSHHGTRRRGGFLARSVFIRTSRETGTCITRRMRAAFSSRLAPGTRLAETLAPYSMYRPLHHPSNYDVRTSFGASAAGDGRVTGRQHRGSAGYVDVDDNLYAFLHWMRANRAALVDESEA
jgi:hypothetical protein